MKHFFISLLLTCECSVLSAQEPKQHSDKPAIDSNAYNKWTSVVEGTICNDGKYASYIIDNHPPGSRTLILTSTQGNWKMAVEGIISASFSPDSRTAVISKPNDTLCIVTLGTQAILAIPSVSSYKFPKGNNAEWIAYQSAIPEKKVVAQNLRTGKRKTYLSANNYWWGDKNSLILQTDTKIDSTDTQSLKWINLLNGDTNTFWEGDVINNLIFDKSGRQLAFTSNHQNKTSKTNIWYYKMGTTKAVLLAGPSYEGLDNSLRIDNISDFNDNGDGIFLTVIKKTPVPTPQPDAVPVNIWSYTDTKLQSQQLSEINNAVKFRYLLSVGKANRYTAILPIGGQRIILLEEENDFLSEKRGHVGFICHRGGADEGERNWNTAAKATLHVISLKTGQRRQLKELGYREVGGNDISTTGKYVVYYDDTQNGFFSFEVASGVIRNITPGVSTCWLNYYGNESSRSPRGVAGWLQEDKGILIYDQHDIWKVDPTGANLPVNLTNGYGRRHNIIFYLALPSNASSPIAENASLFLNAFNLNNKDNGFYRKKLYRNGDPEFLSIGPYLYDIPNNPYLPQGVGSPPIKAQNADVYLVTRMTSTTAPNFFATTDFRHFTALSDLHPEKKYNWYSTELHTWKTLDGSLSQGILYKPENFNPNKKYPVIFYYYERRSDGLNAYLKPEILPNGCTIDIPTYVSNGYLVFSPDIYYTKGDPMQGTYNAVVSAALYVSHLPFVNEKKMGLQGCSFGGIQTNYLVTHTNLFAAACSASGSFNFVSQYGALAGNGSSLQSLFETGQTRMGASLWDIPDQYIKNSPIFQAHKVTTPFLMMHTTNDGVCPFANAVEFFTALRRLGKKVWMLEYTDSDHGVWGKSGVDFSIRMSQFFDHYLKDARPPKWMTTGVPAKMKGVENGLALDNNIQSPGPGLLAEELNIEKKVKKTETSAGSAQTKSKE
jgi:dienelactone hydrolase